MRYPLALLLLTTLLTFSCKKQPGIDREIAAKIIAEQLGFPRPMPLDIYITEQDFISAFQKANLEADGWVTIETVNTLLSSQRFIHFTEKAQPYLLKRSALDMENHIQKVRAADETLVEVVAMGEHPNKTWKVLYTTELNNPTPFAVLLRYGMPKTIVDTLLYC